MGTEQFALDGRVVDGNAASQEPNLKGILKQTMYQLVKRIKG